MSNGQDPLPPPGLDGTYRDTCIVCLHGTDTGVIFAGVAEWAVACLATLGIPMETAEHLVVTPLGGFDRIPIHPILFPVRVCQTCIDKTVFGEQGLKAGLIPSFPVLAQPVEGP